MGNVLSHVRRNGLLSCVCDDAVRVDGHKVDTEDPNLFLRLLEEQHQDIWHDVWLNKYVICIPQSVSLRHRVRREDIGRVGSSKSPAHVSGCVSHVRTNRVRSSAHVVTQRGGDVRYRVGKTIGKE